MSNPIYRYFLTDLLSNEVISEVPFNGVSFERANRRAGSFSGTIPFIEATKGLDLYEATMPGRTGVYVLRDSVCVWGGIIWSRSYSVSEKELSVSGGEFLSYFYHRNIWQTIQYGSDFVGVSSYEVSGGVGTVTTEIAHGFRVGDQIRITFTSPLVDGVQEILQVPSANSFQFSTTSANGAGFSTSGACRSLVDTYDFARNIVFQVSNDLGGVNFASEIIKPAREFQESVIAKERSAGRVTIRTANDHEIIPGQEIELIEVDPELDGIHIATQIPDAQSVTFELQGGDIPRTTLPGLRNLNVVSKQLTDNLATLTVDRPHNAQPGDTVIVEGVDAFFTGLIDTTFNGRFIVISTPTTTSFTFSSGGILNVLEEPVAGGLATFGSKVVYGDFGSFTSNGDIGINFENNAKSGFYQDKQVYRGFEQRTAGEILEEYSNTTDGGF